ncbi:hypothetical protein FOLKNPGA_03436 [Legionella sp. PC1000]|uniref:hypothetical protein n=1 Tax=Legionella sp. PC1000 TaxID=2746060 RepID=UPI0015FE3B5F|nr:hypothetical protein [Legionella sp. PC1000]QLZ70622.1 hypothetical protein FOLKNPGA_03436 [Legionella sp. PC1000]
MDNDFVILTQSAQFYKPRNFFSNTNIKEILDVASGNKKKDTDYLINEYRISKQYNHISFTYSAQVFITERPVYFLDHDQYKDQIFAFIVLVEMDNYLVVFKKSCSPISGVINRYFIKVDYKSLAGTIRNSAHFQKLSVRNMTISNRALRAKTYEAEDLVGLFSTHAAGRSIPYYFKIKDKRITKSFTTKSSRITEYSSRKYLNQIIYWIYEQIKFIKLKPTNKFLSVFANPIDLQEVLNTTQPASILIETSLVLENLEEEEIDIFYTSKITNCKKKLSFREACVTKDRAVVSL